MADMVIPVTAIPRDAGWVVIHKRLERILRQEGLNVSQKQPKRGRLWLIDGSIVRPGPEFPNHVWLSDFKQNRTYHKFPFCILNVIDEKFCECLIAKLE
jgi:hypothetical protein